MGSLHKLMIALAFFIAMPTFAAEEDPFREYRSLAEEGKWGELYKQIYELPPEIQLKVLESSSLQERSIADLLMDDDAPNQDMDFLLLKLLYYQRDRDRQNELIESFQARAHQANRRSPRRTLRDASRSSSRTSSQTPPQSPHHVSPRNNDARNNDELHIQGSPSDPFIHTRSLTYSGGTGASGGVMYLSAGSTLAGSSSPSPSSRRRTAPRQQPRPPTRGRAESHTASTNTYSSPNPSPRTEATSPSESPRLSESDHQETVSDKAEPHRLRQSSSTKPSSLRTLRRISADSPKTPLSKNQSPRREFKVQPDAPTESREWEITEIDLTGPNTLEMKIRSRKTGDQIPLRINRNQQLLGEGEGGSVYKVPTKLRTYAVKISKPYTDTNQHVGKDLEWECKILIHLSQLPACVRTITEADGKQSISYLVKLYERGSSVFSLLYEIVIKTDDKGSEKHVFERKAHDFSRSELIVISINALKTMQWVHAHGVQHRDIKPENVLLDIADGGKVKFCDFASASLTGDCSPVGTRGYIPPDRMRQYHDQQLGRSTQAVDVWAMGVLLLELIGRGNYHQFLEENNDRGRVFTQEDVLNVHQDLQHEIARAQNLELGFSEIGQLILKANPEERKRLQKLRETVRAQRKMAHYQLLLLLYKSTSNHPEERPDFEQIEQSLARMITSLGENEKETSSAIQGTPRPPMVSPKKSPRETSTTTITDSTSEGSPDNRGILSRVFAPFTSSSSTSTNTKRK